jgi:hypothetical protein
MLRIFERKILRMIYGHINVNGRWRTKYNSELYTLHDELDAVKMIKIGILRCMRHAFRMQELDPCRKLTILKQKALV